MTRLNLVLMVLLLASSLWLVRVSHESRRLFAQLDQAGSEARALGSEFERLKAERQAQATPLRVEKAARDRLAMRSATPAVTQYVTLEPDPSLSPAPGRSATASGQPDTADRVAASDAPTRSNGRVASGAAR
jgi:cell division protein FtsL